MDKYAINEWLAFSDMDLTAAKYLCGMDPKLLEIICYHCHQAAEKSLKAFWVYLGFAPPRTHDLEHLLDKCEGFDNSFADLRDESIRLNPYASQPRYPFGLELTEDIMALAIADCEKINESVKSKIIFDEDESASTDNEADS